MTNHTTKKTLHAFGDSFILGDQDDFLHVKDPNVKPTHRMGYNDRIKYLKNHVSFVSHLARHYGFDLQNHSHRGTGNYPQLDKLYLEFAQGNIRPGDVVVFGFTSCQRDRWWLSGYEEFKSDKKAPCFVDPSLIEGNNQSLFELDFFYIISVLDRLSKQFNVPIIKLNLWDNALTQALEQTKNLCRVDDFVGYDTPGNTLIHILNDTWGKDERNFFHHNQVKVLPEHEHLYTYYRHPSVEGHKKIAQWWIDNGILDRFV
jgi:hypothetical protein